MNNKDFWVIATTQDSCKLYAYQVTALGINSPIVSYLGLDYAIFNIEISPKGNKVALKAKNGNQFYRYIIDFNAETGFFSKPFALSAEYELNSVRNTGCSFSPDGNYFYNDEYTNNGGDSLFQYNLNTSDIVSTKTFITKLLSNNDMQIGPDGKIYFGGSVFTLYLDYIEFPNVQGINCSYHKNAIYLGGRIPDVYLPNETLFIKKATTTLPVPKTQPIDLEFNHYSKQLIFHTPDNRKYKTLIYDLQGQLLLIKEISNNTQLNVVSFPIGLYIYSIESELNLLQTGKICIY